MIDFKRNGTSVELVLSLPIPNYNCRLFTFEWNCQNEVYAGLLTERMRQELHKTVQAAREEMYNQGYADGKGKRAKLTWFRGVI